MARGLSPRQLRAMQVMRHGSDWTPAALAKHLDTSKEGAAATASSLVRRGFAERVRIDVHGHVGYRLVQK